MPNNKTYLKYDLWNAQAKTSFVKAKTDWFDGNKFDSRLHLSFVKHKGKPNCEQVCAIEIGIPMVKAGSDGNGKTGVTALSLAWLITSGALARRAAASKQAAKERNEKYADDVWACIGGTTVNRSKDGKAEFRKVSIAPGNAEGTFVMKAACCEGEQSSSMGGVQPKAGAQWTTIMVPVDMEYMEAFALNIQVEWEAHRTAMAVSQRCSLPSPVQPEAKADAEKPAVPEASPVTNAASESLVSDEATTKVQTSRDVWAFYDEIEGPLEVATTPEKAVQAARMCFSHLQKKHGLVYQDKEKARGLMDEILNGRNDTSNASANTFLNPVVLVKRSDSTNKSNQEPADTLFVMVYHNAIV